MVLSPGVFACTMGVASGNATNDGRPLLWKTRDFEVKPNVVVYTQTTQYHFVSNITPEYGYNKSWFGLNNQGFAIANTFIRDFPKGEKGPGNGELMNIALQSCATIKDFKQLLDETNTTGRKTQATFGVIDSEGGAAIFEVGANTYTFYDANDKNIAPDGYIVRTNFAKSIEGKGGIERYTRSSGLVAGFFEEGKIEIKDILQTQMRDLNRTAEEKRYFDCRNNICTPNSISATLIKGVMANEAKELSTMWTMLGSPFASIAVPYWAVGKTPEISSSEKKHALYESSAQLKVKIFNPNKRFEVDLKKWRTVQNELINQENILLARTELAMEKWRKEGIDKKEMLLLEKELATIALKKINQTNSKLKTQK